MSATELRLKRILTPTDFVWLDDKTLLVHQGAVILLPEPEHDRGRVLGYTTLCTESLLARWRDKPNDAGLVVTCFECLGATEQ